MTALSRLQYPDLGIWPWDPPGVLPGVGTRNENRFRQNYIFTAHQVIKKFREFCELHNDGPRAAIEFWRWMKITCGAHENHIRNCISAIVDYTQESGRFNDIFLVLFHYSPDPEYLEMMKSRKARAFLSCENEDLQYIPGINEDLQYIPGIGEAYARRLNAIGINQVSQMMAIAVSLIMPGQFHAYLKRMCHASINRSMDCHLALMCKILPNLALGALGANG